MLSENWISYSYTHFVGHCSRFRQEVYLLAIAVPPVFLTRTPAIKPFEMEASVASILTNKLNIIIQKIFLALQKHNLVQN